MATGADLNVTGQSASRRFHKAGIKDGCARINDNVEGLGASRQCRTAEGYRKDIARDSAAGYGTVTRWKKVEYSRGDTDEESKHATERMVYRVGKLTGRLEY